MTDHVSGPANLLRAKGAGGGRKNGKRRRSPFSARTVAVFLLGLALVGVGVFGSLAAVQGDAIAQGVKARTVDLGGKTAQEAAAALRERLTGFTLTFDLAGATTRIGPADGKGKRVVSYDVERAVKEAVGVGRDTNAIRALAERLNATLFGADVAIPYTFDRVALRAALEEKFSSAVSPARDARFDISIDAAGSPTVNIVAGKEGVSVDYDAVMRAADERLKDLSDEVVDVPTTKARPALSRKDLEPLVPEVIAALERAPLTLTAKDVTWTASKRAVADWIVAMPPSTKDGKPTLGLDKDRVSTYLAGRAEEVAVSPKNAVFEEKDGRVTAFEPSADGEALDIEGSATAIAGALFAGDAAPAEIALPIAVVHPEVDTERSNPYGIKEIIGVGATNFVGSPVNRRHNIAVGAASVNGSLIAPGAEFSLLTTLGKIDASTGYLQELVIKENKTTPEFGGGLCQIGSTTFRAVLDSGLPVTERQNHSYRVPYYERDGDGKSIGPGKDATIYDPAPDFKFLNDTGHEILITTAIDKNKLTFTFWGVRDGRKAEQTTAKVFNIVQPPEKKVVKTTDLKPGETKCTEHAHLGSDAVFTYTVTYPDGTTKTKDFKSHYRPWQEVCLLGVDPSELPPGVTSQEVVPDADAAGAAGTAGN
ncbi:MAG TPA: VanW family protein [Patescibacteria group bacterium]|nr:VanW family protein [Patescibacteria group bacterium]